MLLYGMYLHLYYSCIIYVLPDVLCQEYSLKNRGKLGDRNKVRRRKERSIRVSVYNFLHSSTKFRWGGGGGGGG